MTRLMLALLFTSGLAHGAATIQDALSGYRDVASAVAKDDFADAAMKAAKLAPIAEELSKSAPAPLATCYGNLLKGAKAVAASTKETDIRKSMSLLSEPAVWLVKNTPSLQSKWQLYKCPMVQGAFGYWMQPVGDPMANPYMGQSMLGCGARKSWAKFP